MFQLLQSNSTFQLGFSHVSSISSKHKFELNFTISKYTQSSLYDLSRRMSTTFKNSGATLSIVDDKVILSNVPQEHYDLLLSLYEQYFASAVSLAKSETPISDEPQSEPSSTGLIVYDDTNNIFKSFIRSVSIPKFYKPSKPVLSFKFVDVFLSTDNYYDIVLSNDASFAMRQYLQNSSNLFLSLQIVHTISNNSHSMKLTKVSGSQASVILSVLLYYTLCNKSKLPL